MITYSEDYLEFIKWANLPPVTSLQHEFAEWLIENRSIACQMGDLETIFYKMRQWERVRRKEIIKE